MPLQFVIIWRDGVLSANWFTWVKKVRHEKINGTNFGTNFKTILSMSDWQNDMVPVKHFSTGTHRVSKIVPSDKEEKPYEWNLNYKICIKEPAIDVPMIWQVYVYLK